jgi:arylsulfatase A-like enzyme
MIALLAAALFLSGSVPGEAQVDTTRFNVVIVLADDLGWSSVGFRNPHLLTPHIDSLASTGWVPERFYVEPSCTATRAALLTGLHSFRFGFGGMGIRHYMSEGLPSSAVTIAEILHSLGYTTAIVGKWHLGQNEDEFLPLAQGFDLQIGGYTGSPGFASKEKLGGLDWDLNGVPLRESGDLNTLTAAHASEVIEKHDFDAAPLFLYVAAYAPHQRNPRDRFSPQSLPLNTLADLDGIVGRVMYSLRTKGQWERTLFVFLSDNGAAPSSGLNAPWKGGKGQEYEGAMRVPAVFSWPRGVAAPPAARTAALSVADIFPTVLDLVDAPQAAKMEIDGRSILCSGRWACATERDFLIMHYARPPQGVAAAAIRGPWKAVFTRGREELYDLASDPMEKQNVRDQHGASFDSIAQLVEEQVKDAPRTIWAEPPLLPLGPREWTPACINDLWCKNLKWKGNRILAGSLAMMLTMVCLGTAIWWRRRASSQ